MYGLIPIGKRYYARQFDLGYPPHRADLEALLIDGPIILFAAYEELQDYCDEEVIEHEYVD